MDRTYTETEVRELIKELETLRKRNDELETRLSQKLFDYQSQRYTPIPRKWRDSKGNQYKLVMSFLDTDDVYLNTNVGELAST